MTTLREQDWRAGFKLLHEVASAADGADALAEAAVQSLPALVASEITTLSVCDLKSGHRAVIGTPKDAIGAEDRECFDRYFREHPLVRYHADLRGPLACRISDLVPFSRFRHTGLYSDYYRRIGIDHAVALPIHVDDRTLISFVLNRRGRDFGERERERLDLVGPLLSRCYLQARALDETRSLLARQGLDAPLLDARRVTRREAEVLQWLAAGKTDREIAALLSCSHRTVQKHLQRIYEKLGVETRTAAVMRALGRGVQ
ncbi:MAG: helix-turn-helix transcriptional regulator [Betaproteobacteria bacterium]|nr:MAG: helix-turn-helix transcriptional regulator [Betaproteobacteria bacterium]